MTIAPTLAPWMAQARPFDWRGHRIMHWRGGAPSGTPTLLIHGFPTASWDWHAVWPALTAQGPVLALDLIGFGLSAKPQRYAYSILDQADLCEALLRAEGVTHYHVLAHDYGDSVAQELLARQPEGDARPRLRSIVFLNGGLFPEAHRPLPIQRLLASPLGGLVARLVTRRAFAANLRRIFGPATPPSSSDIDAFWRLIQHHEGRRVMPHLIRYMQERRTWRARWVGALQQAAVPLRLIDGTADPISGATLVQRYRALVPQADVVELDGIGHYPQVEAPDAVLAAWRAFRARVDAG